MTMVRPGRERFNLNSFVRVGHGIEPTPVKLLSLCLHFSYSLRVEGPFNPPTFTQKSRHQRCGLHVRVTKTFGVLKATHQLSHHQQD